MKFKNAWEKTFEKIPYERTVKNKKTGAKEKRTYSRTECLQNGMKGDYNKARAWERLIKKTKLIKPIVDTNLCTVLWGTDKENKKIEEKEK